MHVSAEHTAALLTNPFATRYTRPGSLPPLDLRGRAIDADEMLVALGHLGVAASLRGPHGAGKTTLLTHLASSWEARGMAIERVRLRSCRDTPNALAIISRSPAGGIVCIDSWELAGRSAGWAARLMARRAGCRLLVTEHKRTGLPVLMECRTTAALLASVVSRLPDHAGWFGMLIHEVDIHEAFANSQGNLREALADLYDRFESRRPPVPVPGVSG